MQSLTTLFAHSRTVCVLTLCLLTAGPALAELPQVDNARIIQPPPGTNVAAAYFTIYNSSDEPLILTGVAGDAVENAELHLSSVVDDVAKMEKQDSVTVPAGESLHFKHGSYHVMLMGMREPLEAGTEVDLQLETSAGLLTIVVPVISMSDAVDTDSMNHDHGVEQNMEHDKMHESSK